MGDGRIQGRRFDARQAVDPRTAERRRVLYRAIDARFEFVDPAGQDGNAALPAGPVARREVVEHLLRPCAANRPRSTPWS